jgi:hypothetical protein
MFGPLIEESKERKSTNSPLAQCFFCQWGEKRMESVRKKCQQFPLGAK